MSDYMMDMRKLVGTRPIFQNGASVIVTNEAGHMLLGLRSDNHCWGYAGGSIELGEKLEEAALRELEEEFNIKGKSIRLFGVYSGPELYYKYPNGDEVYNVDTVYICDDYEGTPKADGHEIVEVKFFPLDALPENISPPIVLPIQDYVKEQLK